MVVLCVIVSGIPPSTKLFLFILISSNFYWLNSGIFGNYFSITWCVGSIYMRGFFAKKEERREVKS